MSKVNKLARNLRFWKYMMHSAWPTISHLVLYYFAIFCLILERNVVRKTARFLLRVKLSRWELNLHTREEKVPLSPWYPNEQTKLVQVVSCYYCKLIIFPALWLIAIVAASLLLKIAHQKFLGAYTKQNADNDQPTAAAAAHKWASN